MSSSASERIAPSATKMPEVKGGVVPYVQVSNATEASAFYQRAFGAEEVYKVPPDEQGRTMHIHLYVNGGSLMLCDFIQTTAIHSKSRRHST